MSIKFTNNKKWDDVWFSDLNMEEKLMFIYLCDMCDIAGFYEVNKKLVSLRTGIENVEATIQSLSKSILINGDHIWIKNYIAHQKNTPINIKNGAHKSILKSINIHINKFPEIYNNVTFVDNVTIKKYIEGKNMPPPSGGS